MIEKILPINLIFFFWNEEKEDSIILIGKKKQSFSRESFQDHTFI